MEPKNEVILKSIFDGIFQKDSSSSFLVENYKNFIQFIHRLELSDIRTLRIRITIIMIIWHILKAI